MDKELEKINKIIAKSETKVDDKNAGRMLKTKLEEVTSRITQF